MNAKTIPTPESVLSESKKVITVGKRSSSLRRIFAYTLVGALALNNISILGDGFDTIVLGGTVALTTLTGSQKVPQAPVVQGEQPVWIEFGQTVDNPDVLSEVGLGDGQYVQEALAKDPFSEFFFLSSEEGLKDFQNIDRFFIDHKITPKVAMVIVSHMQIAQGVAVLGRNDPFLMKKEKDRQQQSSDFLWQAWEALQNKDEELFKTLVMDASTDHDVMLNLNQMGGTTMTKGGDTSSMNLRSYDFSFNERKEYHALVDDYIYVETQLAQSFVTGYNQLTQENGVIFEDEDLKNDNLLSAREDVMQATAEAGIAVLYLPQNVAYNIPELRTVATSIRGANSDLQHFTKWDGPVLGMNYRLILDLDTALGSAYTYPDDDGFIHMKTWWDSLGHEWFHLVDFSQNEYVKFMGVGRLNLMPLTSQNNPKYGELTSFGDPYNISSITAHLWQGLENPSLTLQQREGIRNETRDNILKRASMEEGTKETSQGGTASFLAQTEERAGSEVVSEGSPWFHWRGHAGDLEKRQSLWHYLIPSQAGRYLNNPTEVLAFSFAGSLDGYFENQQNNGSPYRSVLLFSNVTQMENLAGYEPTLVEGNAVAPVWRGYFSQLNSWWQADKKARNTFIQSQLSWGEDNEGQVSRGRLMSWREVHELRSIHKENNGNKPAP